MFYRSRSKAGMPVLMAVLVLAAAAVPLASSHVADAEFVGTCTIDLQPGQTWTWEPTFNLDKEVALEVSADQDSMPGSGSAFSSSSGYAQVAGGKVSVALPSGYSKPHYYLSIRGTSTQPTQFAYYQVTFDVSSFSLSYPTDSLTAVVGIPVELVPTLSSTNSEVSAKSFSISRALPSGLTFDSSTGKISGTATSARAAVSYTVTATLDTTPEQTAKTTLSIGATEPQAETCTVTFRASPSGYGTVSESSIEFPKGSAVFVLTDGSLCINGRCIAATPSAPTSQYTYSFTGWSKTSGTIESDTEITAGFSRSSAQSELKVTVFSGHQYAVKGTPASFGFTVTPSDLPAAVTVTTSSPSLDAAVNGDRISFTASASGDFTITITASADGHASGSTIVGVHVDDMLRFVNEPVASCKISRASL